MGRPLNKRFFQSGTGGPGAEIGCDAWFTGEGAAESAYIISQKSNSKYLVGSDAGGATPTRTEVLKLVQGNPIAAGQMQVEVTPELVGAATEADIEIDVAGGVVTAVRLIAPDFGGVGYFTGGTFLLATTAGGGDGFAAITYTVNPVTQAMATVSVSVGGTTYTGAAGQAVLTGDIPDAALAGSEQSARIINARTVKTFEGNIYMWPAVGAIPSADKVRAEADLQAAT